MWYMKASKIADKCGIRLFGAEITMLQGKIFVRPSKHKSHKK